MNRTRPGGGLTNFSEVWEVRPITENEADLFRARLSRGFGGDADADDGAARTGDAVAPRPVLGLAGFSDPDQARLRALLQKRILKRA